MVAVSANIFSCAYLLILDAVFFLNFVSCAQFCRIIAHIFSFLITFAHFCMHFWCQFFQVHIDLKVTGENYLKLFKMHSIIFYYSTCPYTHNFIFFRVLFGFRQWWHFLCVLILQNFVHFFHAFLCKFFKLKVMYILFFKLFATLPHQSLSNQYGHIGYVV